MLKVNFFHICESAIVEQGTSNLSLIGIFENINAPSFPVMHPIMSIVVGFENKNPGIYDTEILFSDEQGEILKIEGKINIGVAGKGSGIYKIVGYQIPREATQVIKLNYEGKTLHIGYLTVNNK